VKKRSRFDVIQSPLESGRILIEASAGTGKTYTIAGIVLRLILEQGLEIEKILVTTYTELATAELRDRIRSLLREALVSFERDSSANELVKPLLERNQSNPEAKERLRRALQAFDDAPIYTIHGFCQRMLKDRAFESGVLFDAEFILDQSPILREIVEDFWRSHFYVGDPIVGLYAQRHGVTPEKLRKNIQELADKPTLIIEPALRDFEERRRNFAALWKKARACWDESSAGVYAIFEDNSWAKHTHANPEKMAVHFANLRDSLADAGGAAEQLKSLEFFAASKVQNGTRAKYPTPLHPLFDCCEELIAAEPALLVSLEAEFFAWARTEMKRRKVQRNVLFFDDLLTRLAEALDREGGAALAHSIRERFPAALIDEFQDTDPVQYAIFDKIYAQSDTRVFFIGDPKQAIYGFRGADVFTYIKAAKAASPQYTLAKNWRSEASLIAAVNTIFDREKAFVLDGIPFQPVAAAGKADAEPLTINGTKEPPFQLWLMKDEKPIGSGEARKRLPGPVAGEIARLLNNDVKIGGRRLEPRDIAVLVTTNQEALNVQEALTKLRIPSAVYGSADVFRSREANELERILSAVIEPTHESLVRAALATETLGLTSEGLEEVIHNEGQWEKRIEAFQQYHKTWQEDGFVQMMRSLLVGEKVRARLLSYPDGERRLTNLLHLTELLHRLCLDSQLGMGGLRKALAEEIRGNDPAQSEERELRLERDEKAVRVVTVHKSKGLQFEIVFCPFSWSGGPKKGKEHVIFHRGDELILDLNKSAENKRQNADESLADNVRRLYVALTRAKHRCYFVWGLLEKDDASAPAYLFGHWPSEQINALAQKKSIAISEVTRGLAEIYRPPAAIKGPLEPKAFERMIDRTYGIASFSRLISGYDKELELPEDEEIEPEETETVAPETATPLSGMFAFPRGTGPGICLHHIFEKLDFSQRGDVGELVRQRLRAFNIREFDEVVCDMIGRVLSVPLTIGEPEFTFSRITKEARLTELEFYFPVGSVKRDRLAKLLEDNRLQFQPISGFMKGFIDLIFEHQGSFYIADWKSNWLGAEVDDYAPAAMEAEMKQKFYNLQLSIYTVALHRFLRARKPGYSYDKHFGGVFYLFLRGIEPSRPELGVHRARPDAGFIEQLEDVLSDNN